MYSRRNSIFSFNFCFIAFVLLYRVMLAASIFANEAPPLGIDKSALAVSAIFASLSLDFTVLIVIDIFLLILYFATEPLQARFRDLSFLAFCMILLCVSVALLFAHFNLIQTMNSGLTKGMFIEFWSIIPLRDFFVLLTPRDWILVSLPPILFFLVLRIPSNRFIAFSSQPFPIVIFFLVLSLGIFASYRTAIPTEYRLNPIAFLFKDVMRFDGAKSTLLTSTPAKMSYAEPFMSDEISEKISQAEQRQFNVIFIILESTASLYMFDAEKYGGGRTPMPYLAGLAKKSLFARQHFASNNSSPRSFFSIFSGLYESPEIEFFSLKRKVYLPHAIDYFGPGFEHFLVTPADLNWYFPLAWFRNRKFVNLFDFAALKQLKEYKAGPTAVRDEMETVDFFIEKIRLTRTPFFGVYYSFVAHWPYPDLGEENRIVPATSSLNRYINNLYVQDKLINRIVESLEKSGKMTNSILVIVGDHGQAFYQHPGNRVHSSASFNENLQSPLIIYAPALLKPTEIVFPTSHADILPTVLNLLNVRYDPYAFQGESLIAPQLHRHYVYSYGNEDTISSISKNMKKLQIFRAGKKCQVYDLKLDPKEMSPASCANETDQKRATDYFLNQQPARLKAYNESLLAK